jgi:hypothetical protein
LCALPPITQACPHLIAQLRRLGDGIVAGFGFALADGACFAARSASWLVAESFAHVSTVSAGVPSRGEPERHTCLQRRSPLQPLPGIER